MLIIKKACEMKKEFFNFVEKLKSVTDEYEDSYYVLDYIFTNKDKNISNNYLVVLKNNKIIDIILKENFCEIPTISLLCFYFKYDKKEFFETLKTYFKDIPFLIDGNSINSYCIWDKNKDLSMEDLGFVHCNTKFSIDETFHLDMGSRYFYTLKGNEDLLRDNFEKKYLPTNVDDLTFEVVKEGELINMLYDKKNNILPSYITDGNHHVVLGFHYLSFQFSSDNATYLIAKNNENKIVGAIKWAIYREGSKYAHYGLNFIDVISIFRKKGIASKLIEELTKHIDNTYPLVLSYESDMGKICQMQKHFKNAKFKTNVFTDKEWENYWLNESIKH